MKGGASIFPFSVMSLYITTILRRCVFCASCLSVNDPTTIMRSRAEVDATEP